jgi:hypothetical protein
VAHLKQEAETGTAFKQAAKADVAPVETGWDNRALKLRWC